MSATAIYIFIRARVLAHAPPTLAVRWRLRRLGYGGRARDTIIRYYYVAPGSLNRITKFELGKLSRKNGQTSAVARVQTYRAELARATVNVVVAFPHFRPHCPRERSNLRR